MERHTDLARRDQRGLSRPEFAGSSFAVLERFADEVDRIFDDLGLARAWTPSRSVRGWSSLSAHPGATAWAPEIELFHRNNELVIRADLPGLTKDDVKVDVTEDHVTIQGERKQEHREERGGLYRSERSYGTFCRDIPLPPGINADQAKATFRDGVLEITMPEPPESARHGRRLEIADRPVERPVVQK